ncbi:hypothetical protein B0A80_19245 [Flavobacterium tructae]|uniref:hypothetical protein n=1 Tax=Flavobacterium tructae TaxID=1114873 RepID=UPI000B5B7FA5|nr:hypothetical protein [Flavobacterium tructae]OXB20234.1 hypothetical protein B0A80_19245 [Flavobacterium tructae]
MKIVLVINAMITNKEKISNILLDQQEIYFLYNNKYKWSIEKVVENWSNQYELNFYPKNPDAIVEDDLEDIIYKKRHGSILNVATYSTSDLKGTETYESFKELYQLLIDKFYGIDDMFEDILTPPF